MQKTFNKYVVTIITAAIFLILIINVMLSKHSLEIQQYNSFQAKIGQVIHTLDNNRRELELLKRNLDKDYLTRAREAAYVVTSPWTSLRCSILQNCSMLMSFMS